MWSTTPLKVSTYLATKEDGSIFVISNFFYQSCAGHKLSIVCVNRDKSEEPAVQVVDAPDAFKNIGSAFRDYNLPTAAAAYQDVKSKLIKGFDAALAAFDLQSRTGAGSSSNGE